MHIETMPALQDQTGRSYRNQKIFEMAKAALTGILAAHPINNQDQLEEATSKALHAAKLMISKLIEERAL